MTLKDLDDVIEAAHNHRGAKGSEIHWISSSSTYGSGKIYCIVNNNRQADAYFDIAIDLFGNPNVLEIMEDYFGSKPQMIERI